MITYDIFVLELNKTFSFTYLNHALYKIYMHEIMCVCFSGISLFYFSLFLFCKDYC